MIQRQYEAVSKIVAFIHQHAPPNQQAPSNPELLSKLMVNADDASKKEIITIEDDEEDAEDEDQEEIRQHASNAAGEVRPRVTSETTKDDCGVENEVENENEISSGRKADGYYLGNNQSRFAENDLKSMKQKAENEKEKLNSQIVVDNTKGARKSARDQGSQELAHPQVLSDRRREERYKEKPALSFRNKGIVNSKNDCKNRNPD